MTFPTREPLTIELLDQIDQNPFLTIAEVAKLLRVDYTTVRRWVQNGLIAATVLPTRGRRHVYRIWRTEVEKILGASIPPQSEG